MPIDDTALLQRWITRRDAEAFDEIVRRFADQVFGTCRRILRNDADAEEVAQECFLLLVRSGGEVRSSLGGWLHRAATSRSLDRIRSESRRRIRERAYVEAASQVAEATWDDLQEHVDAAIDQLPESTRDMIVAHFLGRKTHEEIASELGMNRRAVSQRIQRGLESIRRDFAKRGVTLSAAALGPFLAANTTAAPISLKASLGKLAIAAGTTGPGGAVTTTSLIGSLLIMKTKICLASITLALFGLSDYVAYRDLSPLWKRVLPISPRTLRHLPPFQRHPSHRASEPPSTFSGSTKVSAPSIDREDYSNTPPIYSSFLPLFRNYVLLSFRGLE